MSNPESDLAGRAEALQASVQELTNGLAVAQSQVRRVRRVLRFAVIGIIFDVVLSLGLGYVGVQARQASERATEASSATTVGCLALNEAKAIEREVWEHLFLITPTTPRTDEQRKQADELKAYFAEKFRPSDCLVPSAR